MTTSGTLPKDHPERVQLRERLERILSESGMGEVRVLPYESAEHVLTKKRCELVAVLRHEDVASVRGLARRVERDNGQVSRDLKILAENDVVDFEDTGREKRPYLQYDYFFFEPV